MKDEYVMKGVVSHGVRDYQVKVTIALSLRMRKGAAKGTRCQVKAVRKMIRKTQTHQIEDTNCQSSLIGNQ